MLPIATNYRSFLPLTGQAWRGDPTL